MMDLMTKNLIFFFLLLPPPHKCFSLFELFIFFYHFILIYFIHVIVYPLLIHYGYLYTFAFECKLYSSAFDAQIYTAYIENDLGTWDLNNGQCGLAGRNTCVKLIKCPYSGTKNGRGCRCGRFTECKFYRYALRMKKKHRVWILSRSYLCLIFHFTLVSCLVVFFFFSFFLVLVLCYVSMIFIYFDCLILFFSFVNLSNSNLILCVTPPRCNVINGDECLGTVSLNPPPKFINPNYDQIY